MLGDSFTVIHLDFETFSTAGYQWDPVKQRWGPIEGQKKTGLPVVGAEVYALHPSTRIVCMAWDDNLWWPGDPDPVELFHEIERGTLLGAWNSQFEWWIWHCCQPNWPKIPLAQIVDTAPRARAWSMPGALANVAKVMQIDAQKDTEGKRLMRTFSMPRQPTKLDNRLVIMPAEAPDDAAAYGRYCRQDVIVERELTRVLPELSPLEQRVWALDQEINVRGLPVDLEAVENAAEILRQAGRVLNAELEEITQGAVTSSGEIAKILAWVKSHGEPMVDMKAPTVTATLDDPSIDAKVRRVLEIRQALGSISTKKVWAFRARTTPHGRCHGQFIYGGADRTLRWAGYGIQPHNFPRGDAKVRVEGDGAYGSIVGELTEWGAEASAQFIQHLNCRNYHELAARWGDVLKALGSSLRGFIKASPGKRLVCADYSAIEAVGLAVLAGEQWRIDVFKTHGKIYETSASKITGTPLEEYLAYKQREGKHHPDRQGLGKVAELASGYGGSVGAWKNFGAEKFFTPERCEEHREQWLLSHGRGRDTGLTLQDYAIREQVRAWRKSSPAIVAFWKGLESAALSAVREPGTSFAYRDIVYQLQHGTLYCTLPSGRRMAYHNARVGPGKFGSDVLYYHGWNSNPKFGAVGWVELDSYGGKLTENVVQAVCRDLLAWGLLKVAEAGYSIIGHVHDEIITEEPNGCGSVTELERLMLDLPPWAKDWPLRAEGWEGPRFRK